MNKNVGVYWIAAGNLVLNYICSYLFKACGLILTLMYVIMQRYILFAVSVFLIHTPLCTAYFLHQPAQYDSIRGSDVMMNAVVMAAKRWLRQKKHFKVITHSTNTYAGDTHLSSHTHTCHNLFSLGHSNRSDMCHTHLNTHTPSHTNSHP